jgi:hypothetical protein
MEFLVENAYFIVVTVIGNVTVIVTVIVHGYISIRLNKLQEGIYQAVFPNRSLRLSKVCGKTTNASRLLFQIINF